MVKRNYYRLMQDPWNDEVHQPVMTDNERHYLSSAETYKRILESRENDKQQKNSNSNAQREQETARGYIHRMPSARHT